VLSLRGVPDQVAYSAAKHGLLGLTRALAHLSAPRRITVNCLCPGWTRTEMAEGRMRELGLSAEQIAASVPIGRFVEPDEVASMALYLLSDAAAAITGQVLLVDGGSMA
jgi:NAD(P)-dependent dehydrogenase (short-subunit alcohol dehydrogenase family)